MTWKRYQQLRFITAAFAVLFMLLVSHLRWNNTTYWSTTDGGSKPPRDFTNSKIKGTAKTSVNSKHILFYTTLYGRPISLPSEGFMKQCKYKCTLSVDKNDFNKSDAVVFHMYNMGPEYEGLGYKEFVIEDLPKRQTTEQKWVLFVREPNSFYYAQQLKQLNNLFNLTMTFQMDADVHYPYYTLAKLSGKKTSKRKSYLNKRTKGVAWLVSNCFTSSRREEYVKELQKYIPVDIYGKCGINVTEINDNKQRSLLSKNYKFYLAFENSDCDDYVTEKFWSSLQTGMIPIVRGRKVNYEKLAPPNSYIHVDNFRTTAELVSYLETVAVNSTLYNTYHQWRLNYGINRLGPRMASTWICSLCEKVYQTTQKSVDVYEQFSEDTRCYVFNRTRDRSREHMQDLEHYVPQNVPYD